MSKKSTASSQLVFPAASLHVCGGEGMCQPLIRTEEKRTCQSARMVHFHALKRCAMPRSRWMAQTKCKRKPAILLKLWSTGEWSWDQSGGSVPLIHFWVLKTSEGWSPGALSTLQAQPPEEWCQKTLLDHFLYCVLKEQHSSTLFYGTGHIFTLKRALLPYVESDLRIKVGLVWLIFFQKRVYMLLRAGNPNTYWLQGSDTHNNKTSSLLSPTWNSLHLISCRPQTGSCRGHKPTRQHCLPYCSLPSDTLATWKSFVTITSHDESATVRPQKASLSVSKMYRPQHVTSTGSRAKVWEVLLSIQWQSFWVLKSDTQIVLLTPGLCFLHRKIPCFSGKFVSNKTNFVWCRKQNLWNLKRKSCHNIPCAFYRLTKSPFILTNDTGSHVDIGRFQQMLG